MVALSSVLGWALSVDINTKHYAWGLITRRDTPGGGGGGHSGTEGGRTRVTYFAEEGVSF